MSPENKIPEATIERIARYLRPLENLVAEGTMVVSSERLAGLCRVRSAQVRKDLSFFGEFGVRGVGYDVTDLLIHIKKILVSDRERRLAIVGLGNMGMSLIQHENFFKRGYRFVAAFDADPQRIGRHLPNGLMIHPLDELRQIVEVLGVEVGVIATQPSEAQKVADELFQAGIKAILNCSPIQVRQPECCLVENMDFSVNLDNLAYHLGKTD
jgi:redox-sensing transcriptional repressor